MFVWYFKEENTLRFWRLCGRMEKTRRKETAVTLQQLRYVTAVAGTGTISHAVPGVLSDDKIYNSSRMKISS